MVFLSFFSSKNTKIPGLMPGIFILSLSLLIFTYANPPRANSWQHSFVAPPLALVHMTFGFHEVMADALWIRAIQDLDYCEQSLEKKACEGGSWLYQMLDVATEMSPRFRVIYLSGAISVSVLVGDVKGASHLFEKGIQNYPNDWRLLYQAGYHFMYEDPQPIKAAGYLERAAQNGGPFWLNSLASRLYVQSGNKELAEELLRRMIAEEKDPALIQRMREKMEDLDSK